MSLPHDPLWPRAASFIKNEKSGNSDIAIIGVPASKTSLSQTSAHLTPNAVRSALMRYSLAHTALGVDIASLSIVDAGDVISPDVNEVETIEEIRAIRKLTKFLIALGGDNSITYSGFLASGASTIITLDAHYDLRDGKSNGSPIQRLIENGLSGKRVIQIGIADFSNSPAYASRARDYGITVIPRREFRNSSVSEIWRRALSHAEGDIYVDIDMDVCDRSIVPACPAAAPGGISADELRQLAFLIGATSNVTTVDITEIDASQDSADERTIRLAALAVLEIAAGFSTR